MNERHSKKDPSLPQVVMEDLRGIELRRDYSHAKNRQETQIEELVATRGMAIAAKRYTRIGLHFNDWVARTATPAAEAESLRRDFLEANEAVREAFQIQPQNGDISFSWPCLISPASMNRYSASSPSKANRSSASNITALASSSAGMRGTRKLLKCISWLGTAITTWRPLKR